MTQSMAPQLLQLAIDSQITQYAAGRTFCILRHLFVELFRSVSSVAVLVFDCFISLGREMEMVWKRSKSPIKWLYIWNRYFTLAMTSFFASVVISQTPSNEVQGTCATIIVGVVDVILLLRIWILCDRSRRIMYVLLVMIIVEFGVMLGIITATVNSNLFMWGCYAHGTVPSYFSVFPIPSFIVSSSMFIVTIQNCRRRIAVSRPYNTHSIAVVFLRDGVLWFLVSALLGPPQIALFAWGRPTLLQLLMLPSFAGFSIIGARVLLNMMEVAAQGPAPDAIELQDSV
ncbi:hypothetical protein C8R45DRAFT_1109022 [Mycena sanguinolenta]|nr:hypothetical protein C8R45DRAFT_1109022 [Mycena sanguinolenta]